MLFVLFSKEKTLTLLHFSGYSADESVEPDLLAIMSALPVRSATVARKTNETDIQVSLTLDTDPSVSQVIQVSTGIGFLDHVSSLLCSLYALYLSLRFLDAPCFS